MKGSEQSWMAIEGDSKLASNQTKVRRKNRKAQETKEGGNVAEEKAKKA